MRTIKQPREAELTMRLAQSMAPELLENLIDKILVLMNNLSYLISLSEKTTRPDDAYLELIECYEMSESYSKDLKEYIQIPAAMYYHKEVKELKEDEIDEYFALRFRVHVIQENELYRQCGELFFIADGKWPQLMEILRQLPARKNDFRMCLIYLSYQQRWLKRHFVEPFFGSTEEFLSQPTAKKSNKPIKEFREFINEAWRTEIIMQKLHRLIGNKRNKEALKIITRAWWIGWLSDKPTATSIKNEFSSSIDCSESYIGDCLKEAKPNKNGKVDEEAIELIRLEYERA